MYVELYPDASGISYNQINQTLDIKIGNNGLHSPYTEDSYESGLIYSGFIKWNSSFNGWEYAYPSFKVEYHPDMSGNLNHDNIGVDSDSFSFYYNTFSHNPIILRLTFDNPLDIFTKVSENIEWMLKIDYFNDIQNDINLENDFIR